jgi:DNA-binding response OmpR family regulator/tetratricopeptide (TPR) repeat protein
MSIRLYLVEDDPTISRMLEASLARYGFEITHYADGQSAIDEFKAKEFDVALIDVSLPRKDGFQVAQAIRTSPGGNQVGVVMMSAHEQGPDVVLKMRKAQVDAWMNKPLSLRDLRDKLAELAHKYTGATNELLRVAGARSGLRDRSAAEDRPRKEVTPAVQEIKKTTPRPAPATMPPPTPAPSQASGPPAPPVVAAPGFSQVPKTGAGELVEDRLGVGARPIDSLTAVPRAMLDAARQHRTGILHLKHKDAEAKAAYSQGVLVGASENSPDNRLLTRLVRRGVLQLEEVVEVQRYAHEHKLRVAEAVLAMNRCDAETLLDELTQQASDRLTLAASWSQGEMWFEEKKETVEMLAISSFDAFEVILRRFARFSQMNVVDKWLSERGEEPVTTSKDFEDGLVAYARIAPTSPLPGVLFSNPANLRAIAEFAALSGGDTGPLRAHIYGMWVAGMLRLQGDPKMDTRPVPRPVRSDDVESLVPDKEAVALVRGAWLRAQGRDYYGVLSVGRDAPDEAIWEALGVYNEMYGRDAVAGKNLGPVEGLAEELWALIDDISSTLCDADQRAAYDEITAPPVVEEEEDSSSLGIEADTSFLEGRIALQGNDLQTARACFEKAVEHAPDDVEYSSHLAWVEFLEGAARIDGAVTQLREAAAAHPNSMRPLLLLGLAAERLGFPAAAVEPLREALHRTPDDPEVMSAILRVEKLISGE